MNDLAVTLAVNHADRELTLAGFYDKKSGYERRIAYNVTELIKLFADQEHSWASAQHCLAVFNKLAKFEPLTALTGADDEWEEVYYEEWRNTRCHRVFKDTRGAYDIDTKIFRSPDGFCSVYNDHRTRVEFPYTPRTDYVDIDVSGNCIKR